MKQEKSFEESMKRLEEVIGKLENGNGSLEEMLKLYEEGVSLYRECDRQLGEYEEKLTKISLKDREEQL